MEGREEWLWKRRPHQRFRLGRSLWLPDREGYLFLSSGAERDFLIRLLSTVYEGREALVSSNAAIKGHR